jgi:hypothetical protein
MILLRIIGGLSGLTSVAVGSIRRYTSVVDTDQSMDTAHCAPPVAHVLCVVDRYCLFFPWPVRCIPRVAAHHALVVYSGVAHAIAGVLLACARIVNAVAPAKPGSTRLDYATLSAGLS